MIVPPQQQLVLLRIPETAVIVMVVILDIRRQHVVCVAIFKNSSIWSLMETPLSVCVRPAFVCVSPSNSHLRVCQAHKSSSRQAQRALFQLLMENRVWPDGERRRPPARQSDYRLKRRRSNQCDSRFSDPIL